MWCITGVLNNNDRTDDTVPTFTIILPADAAEGDTLTLYDADGEVKGTHILTADNISNGGGFAVIEPTAALSLGIHTLHTTLTDKAGNESDDSETITLIVDTENNGAPIIDHVSDNVGSITGKLSNKAQTDDTTPTVTIVLPAEVSERLLFITVQALLAALP